MAKNILVVDDDGTMRAFLATVLRDEGYRVEEAVDGADALGRVGTSGFDLVLTDLRMPGLTGVDLLKEGRPLAPDTRWVVITAHGSIGSAVEAMRAGASDYLTKPLRDPDELRHVVRRVLAEGDAQRRIALLSEEVGRNIPPTETIFLGSRMREVEALVRDVAPTTATVLVTGPSGTGKELVARAIHGMSPRRGEPFVAVHCAALAETLLESELFGHERGAFTGASSLRKGRFEAADGGTLFLDEAGEIPPSVQVKLLRVLQERTIERVGGSRPIPVDVRVVAATNRDLRADVSSGRFREDLFYRLNVFPIPLPPLSERRDALPALTDYFVRKYAASFGREVPVVSEEARAALLSYSWPGNVRELQNVVERAVILARGEIEPRHLNLEAGAVGADAAGIREDMPKAGGRMRDVERETIRKALAETGGNRRQAADLLGIALRTLQYRIKEYGL